MVIYEYVKLIVYNKKEKAKAAAETAGKSELG